MLKLILLMHREIGRGEVVPGSFIYWIFSQRYINAIWGSVLTAIFLIMLYQYVFVNNAYYLVTVLSIS